MQSLRADQSSYNCKGVCYVFIHWSFAGLFPIGNNGERKFTTFLVICPKNDDENLIHAARIAQRCAKIPALENGKNLII